MMPHSLRLCLVLAILACRKAPPSDVDKFGDLAAARDAHPGAVAIGNAKQSPDLRQLADSLARLDPTAEAGAAMLRGDLRYLAICRSKCVPLGVPGDTVCFLEGCFNARPSDIRAIDGTEALVVNADGARLDSVATAYGARYNRVIRSYRRSRTSSRPVS